MDTALLAQITKCRLLRDETLKQLQELEKAA